MAGETGSARQEAERLVATVLAMTRKIDDETLSGTADRLFAGLSQVGTTLGEFVARATEDPAESRREPAAGPGGGPGSEPTTDAAGSAEPAQPEAARADGSRGGDVWAQATDVGPRSSSAADAGSTETARAETARAETAAAGMATAGAARAEDGGAGDAWAWATGGGQPGRDGAAAGGGQAGRDDATAGGGQAGRGGSGGGGWSVPGDDGVWAWATGAVRQVVGDGGGSGTQVRHGWSTGSVECCVCPVCRMIATMRNPTPESAERLAGGAGDFASGVVSLMRAFSAVSGTRSRPARRTSAPPPPPDPDLAWSAATRRGSAPVDVPEPPDDDESPWTAATRTANRESVEREAVAKAERDRVAKAKAEQDRLARESAAREKREVLARQKAEREQTATDPAAAGTRPGGAAAGTPTDGAAGGGAGNDAAAGGERRDEVRGLWGWNGGDRVGDVWARATADPGVGGAAGAPTVDHDGTGDAARD